MTELLYRFLRYISDTNGFIVFVAVITVGYAGIWFLFLFEAVPKPARTVQPAAQDEGTKKKVDNAAKGEKKAKGKGQKQKGKEPATSRA